MNLLALIGGGKGKGDSSKEESPLPKPTSDSPARAYAREAFSAVKDDDEAGFVDAFTSAVEACVKKCKASKETDADEEA